MLNRIIIMGRLTRDPELRHTTSGVAVASFSLAVDRDFRDKTTNERQTDFIDVVAWRQTGEFVSKYFQKGSLVVVEGRLQMRDWQDRDGNKRRNAEVIADSVYFGSSKNSADGGVTPAMKDSAAQASKSYGPPADGATVVDDFHEFIDDDGDLPF